MLFLILPLSQLPVSYNHHIIAIATEYWQVSRYSHTGLPIFKQNLNFANYVFHCLMQFLESFSPPSIRKSIWNDSKAQTWKIWSRMWCPVRSLLSAVRTSEHPSCIRTFYDRSTIVLMVYCYQMKMKLPHLITFSTKYSIKIDCKGTEEFKTTISHFGRLTENDRSLRLSRWKTDCET